MNAAKGDLCEEDDLKRNYCQCCVKMRLPRNSPQIWNLRNDSSHVSSLLAPDYEERSEYGDSYQKRPIKSASLCAKRSETSTHCDGCYCRDSPNLPLFDLKPRLLNEVRHKQNIRSNLNGLCRHKRGHGVKRIPKETTAKPNGIDRIGDELNLNYTDVRGDYELRTDDLGKLTKKNYEDEGVNVRPDGTPLSYKEFKELVDFRKDQYFDCHSLENTGAVIAPKHKCVHKFVINERLLPEPLNCDNYGVSRCEICNKPMEPFENIPKKDTDNKKKKKSLNKVKQLYEYNLTPPRLNIGKGSETVQIKIPEKLNTASLWECPEFKIKRKVPGNSFALRYQKGCF